MCRILLIDSGRGNAPLLSWLMPAECCGGTAVTKIEGSSKNPYSRSRESEHFSVKTPYDKFGRDRIFSLHESTKNSKENA